MGLGWGETGLSAPMGTWGPGKTFPAGNRLSASRRAGQALVDRSSETAASQMTAIEPVGQLCPSWASSHVPKGGLEQHALGSFRGPHSKRRG